MKGANAFIPSSVVDLKDSSTPGGRFASSVGRTVSSAFQSNEWPAILLPESFGGPYPLRRLDPCACIQISLACHCNVIFNRFCSCLSPPRFHPTRLELNRPTCSCQSNSPRTTTRSPCVFQRRRSHGANARSACTVSHRNEAATLRHFRAWTASSLTKRVASTNPSATLRHWHSRHFRLQRFRPRALAMACTTTKPEAVQRFADHWHDKCFSYQQITEAGVMRQTTTDGTLKTDSQERGRLTGSRRRSNLP